MYIQLIQGKVADEERLRRRLDQWESELMPGAVGYLGTTAGFCDDGTFVALARFESAEAARRNSQRPEQSTWWADTATCFSGDVSFVDCAAVRTWLDGGSDDAGFVQIMEGHSPDAKRMHDLMSQAADGFHHTRPEIIGGLMCEADDGTYVDAIYFTSEADARDGEQRNIPDDLSSTFEEGMQLMGEISYLDLHHPMLTSAAR